MTLSLFQTVAHLGGEGISQVFVSEQGSHLSGNELLHHLSRDDACLDVTGRLGNRVCSKWPWQASLHDLTMQQQTHQAAVEKQQHASSEHQTQDWTVLAKPTGMTPWSQHGRRPPQSSPGVLLIELVLCIALVGLALAKPTITGAFHGETWQIHKPCLALIRPLCTTY